MNNFIAEIAEKLGVKMGEEFRIKSNRDPVNYFFTEKGLKARYPFLDDDSLFAANTLMALITGEVEIAKMPWLPSMVKNTGTFTRTMGRVAFSLGHGTIHSRTE